MRKLLNTTATLIITGCIGLLFANSANATLVNSALEKSTASLTFPSLPTLVRENKFHDIRVSFEERSKLFLKGRHFQNWKPNRSEKDILEEFKRIEEWRNHTWYSDNTGELIISRPDFMVAQDLLEKGYYNSPNSIPFEYNQTDGSYNSSSITLNNYRFLVLEAPTAKTSPAFFKLLQNFQVTDLIDLTPNKGMSEKSNSHLKGRLLKKEKDSVFQVPLAGTQKTFPVRYFECSNWSEPKGISAEVLLKFVRSVSGKFSADEGLVACHSTAEGSDRTGSFIAAFLIMQEIDRQLAAGIKANQLDISIEKIIMQLSLQRMNLVPEFSQYLSLYRLVDLYVQSKAKIDRL